MGACRFPQEANLGAPIGVRLFAQRRTRGNYARSHSTVKRSEFTCSRKAFTESSCRRARRIVPVLSLFGASGKALCQKRRVPISRYAVVAHQTLRPAPWC